MSLVTSIRSVTRATRILELVAAAEEGLSLRSIARHLDVNETTVHNFLVTLVEDGYLAQHRPRGPYGPGSRLMALAEKVRSGPLRLAETAIPWMRSFQREVDETLHLSVLVGKNPTDVLVMEGGRSVRFNTAVGNRMPLRTSAAGKVLTAWRNPGELTWLLGATAADPGAGGLEQVSGELKHVRTAGFAVNIGESDPATRCIAGPIRDDDGDVIAALSMSAPASSYPGTSVKQLRGLMLATVEGISSDLRTPKRDDLDPSSAGL